MSSSAKVTLLLDSDDLNCFMSALRAHVVDLKERQLTRDRIGHQQVKIENGYTPAQVTHYAETTARHMHKLIVAERNFQNVAEALARLTGK